MTAAFLIGRIIVGLYFISSGMRHFTHLKMMAGYAGSKGVPVPQIGVPASGLLILLGGVSILLGAWPTYGAIAILVFLLPTTFMMHNFWAVQDPMQKMNDMINFTKNWALIGYTLMILAVPRPWPYSV
jgi:putative oxidoreductase